MNHCRVIFAQSGCDRARTEGEAQLHGAARALEFESYYYCHYIIIVIILLLTLILILLLLLFFIIIHYCTIGYTYVGMEQLGP